MAKNPNFNRNYFKGVQFKAGGGAVLDLRGCITLPVRTAINRRR